jgi:hypothetical protein
MRMLHSVRDRTTHETSSHRTDTLRFQSPESHHIHIRTAPHSTVKARNIVSYRVNGPKGQRAKGPKVGGSSRRDEELLSALK